MSRLGRVRPVSFFAGLACGLLALSLIGRLLPHREFAARFIRFHPIVSIDSNLFPTALQLRAVLLEREPSPDIIHVVVGGSSVFNGVGQDEAHLWTRRLQDILGARYLVTNVATRGGGPADFGLIAMNMLLREGRRALYVADGAPHAFVTEPGATAYTFMAFDAAARGLLLPWPPRDQALVRLGNDPAFGERALAAQLNTWLSFNDLWTYMRYEYYSTVYLAAVGGRTRSFLPLRAFPDPEPPPEHYARTAYTAPLAAEMRIVRGAAQPWPQVAYDRITESIADSFPPAVRERTVAFVLLNSPYYLEQLSVEERSEYSRNAAATAAAIEQSGVAALTVGAPLEAPDYVDRTHISAAGAEKLAPVVAARVRALATRLGYAR